MRGAETVRTGVRLRPATAAALLAGAAAGGWAGWFMRSSGMFYSDLFVGGVLAVVVLAAGLGAAAAAVTHRDRAAHSLAGFAITAVVATGVLFAVAPSYRGPDAGTDRLGRATIHIAELVPAEGVAIARCRTRDGEPSVFRVEASSPGSAGQSVSLTLQIGPSTVGGWPVPWLRGSLVTMPESPILYATAPGSVEPVLDSADGLRGHLRFTAEREPDPYHPAGSAPARLSGTLEWDCTTPLAP